MKEIIIYVFVTCALVFVVSCIAEELNEKENDYGLIL